MKTSSRQFTLKTLALGAAALLPIATAAVVLAVTAADAPPGAPIFASDTDTSPTGGVFVYNSAAQTGTIRFVAVTQTPAPATIGYRLYLGTAARTAGSPYVLGNTPCDIGASTTANIQTCLVPPASIANASIHVAVTAYNQFGNEGDYSADRVFVPVLPPSNIVVAPVGGNTKQMSLNWVQGTAPGNITAAVITEVFRRPAGSTGAYAKIFNASGTTFTDSGLTRDTSYEYVFRSKATPTGSPVSTYSTVTATQTKTATIPEDSFDTFSIPGNRGVSNPIDLGSPMVAGERAQISQVGGNVVFDTQDGTPNCTYATGPNGLSQATYDANASFCYPIDYCDPDPRENINHAALLVKVGGGQPNAVGNGGPVSGPGQLSFLVNDCRPSNNSGSFSVRVTIGKP